MNLFFASKNYEYTELIFAVSQKLIILLVHKWFCQDLFVVMLIFVKDVIYYSVVPMAEAEVLDCKILHLGPKKIKSSSTIFSVKEQEGHKNHLSFHLFWPVSDVTTSDSRVDSRVATEWKFSRQLIRLLCHKSWW